MELLKAIKERRSIRKFTSDPIDRALLEKIIKESMWAPSGMNTQPWKFIVLEGKAKDEFIEISNKAVDKLDARLRELFGEDMRSFIRGYFRDLGGAPTIIVVLNRFHDKHVYMHSSYVSAAAAIYNLCLLAHEAGLSTCWMTGQLWVEDELLEYLKMDKQGWVLSGVIPIGYNGQKVQPPVPPRKDEEIIWLG